MAEQSHHDVVNQSLSADAPPSVDVSATQSTVSAARAAGEEPSSTPNHYSEPHPDDAEGESTKDTPSAADASSQDYSKGTDSNTNGSGSATGQEDVAAFRHSESGLEEDAVKNAQGEGSVGSDTDTSRPDAAAGETKESVQRYAVKKSAGFKPVSVTKNFLAKAGSVSLPAKSTNEKSPATPGGSLALSAQLAPRPRLVAKSVGVQRGSLPKTMSLAAKGSSSGGPDPNQVWNKNKVQAPQAIPKQLTDEELRQQYGIQLASRPLEDGDSNQAKWADIDDEDDWAPETIEWNDGTKVNLAENAAAAAAAVTVETTSAPEEPPKEEMPNASSEAADSQIKPTSIGPNATVLKLGAGGQHRASNSISKSSQDKPSLVSKPSGSGASKSPWAALPMIDKVSPVLVNAPSQPGLNRFGQRDTHGFDAIPPPPGPHAKEIEADDFSRFSRDTNGVTRELYVPQSGRYEPVRDTRRQPARNDGNYRQPSVLQRPPHHEHEMDGPPGPSAAFQTNRTQQDPGSWSRRRASSGVSGESGKFGRRMSIGRNYDAKPSGDARRGSHIEQSIHRDASPAHSHGKSMASQSPTVSVGPEAHPTVTTGNVQTPPADAAPAAQPEPAGEDPVAMQKRLMREKREAAIKRRKDEEEKAEAEKRERIRIKMEQLGMSVDGKAEKKDKDTDTDAQKPKQAPEDTSKPTAREPATARLTSPPKPPAPNASGEPQQYGLMKVHAPQPAHLTSPRSAGAVPSKAPTVSTVHQENANPQKTDTPNLPNGDPPRHAADDQGKPQDESDPGDASNLQSWSNLQQQPPPGGLAGWSAGTIGAHPPSASNLWGPPSNHRALGNGDFQNNLQRPNLKPTQQNYVVPHGPNAPPPIGTPRQHPSNRTIAAPSKSDLLGGNLIDDLQGIPTLTPPDSTPHRNADIRSDNRGPFRPSHGNGPLLQNAPGASGPSQIESPQTGLAAWAKFSTNNNRAEAEQEARDHAARVADPNQGGSRSKDPLPVLQETWKQVGRGSGPGQRHIIGSTQVTNNYAPSGVPQPPVDFHHIGTGPGASHARSRFQDIFEHQRGSAPQATAARAPSPSIPPPDSNEHPAYIGGHNRPLVNLPGSRHSAPESDKPVVKLPPSKGNAKSSPAPPSAPARVQSWSGVVKQTSVNQTWQDRINGLWAPKGAPSPPVQTASKPRFDIQPVDSTLSITLPPKLGRANLDTVPKTAEEEEALFEEEREFGSIPTTNIPALPPNHPAWAPAPKPDWKDRRFRSLRDDTIFSVLPNPAITGEETRAAIMVTVMVRGMPAAVIKTLSRDPNHASRRLNRPSGRRNAYRTPKGRESSHGSAAPVNGPESTPTKDPVSASGKSGTVRSSKNHRPSRGSRNPQSSPAAKS